MGKFLRDKHGNPVAVDGGLVLEKTLDRKPRDCERCGFNKWVKDDKIFVLQKTCNTTGMQVMEWICPDCALRRGLPPQHYHKNFYSPGNPDALRLKAMIGTGDGSDGDGTTNPNNNVDQTSSSPLACGGGGDGNNSSSVWDWSGLFCHS